ncbi:MAG: glutamine-hydrolyzing carbamoyl-phosphate synthase small subunit, partial [Clostridia bacterium]|nr:glutamine-hydrolyzing carbamoyl-phosphate synthase small subunit [Clostridia bacterium]
MTYPVIGNYGMADEDYESERPSVSAMIVRDYVDEPSNFRSTKTLSEAMKDSGTVGVSGVDTRALTRVIRDHGSMRAIITGADVPDEAALLKLQNAPVLHDSVSRVSRRTAEFYPSKERRFHIVAVDCGMKQNIVRSLNARGCDVTAVPWNTKASDIEALSPDGVFLSNGPGDPTDVVPVIESVKALIGKYPVFGICLGHQILSLAYGAKTYKLKFGHRGGNHPVKNLITGKIEITSQNHSYAVDPDCLSGTSLKMTHVNLLDNTVEGVECEKDLAFGVQYHPESAPGPQDSAYLFDKFIANIKRR